MPCTHRNLPLQITLLMCLGTLSCSHPESRGSGADLKDEAAGNTAAHTPPTVLQSRRTQLIEATITFDADVIRLARVRKARVNRGLPPQDAQHTLHFSFSAQNGVSVEGTVNDPRWAREAHQAPGQLKHRVGALTLQLPGLSGTLRFSAAKGGKLLAAFPIDPRKLEVPRKTGESAGQEAPQPLLGNDAAPYRILLLPEGFQEVQRGDYEQTARRFAQKLEAVLQPGKAFADYAHLFQVVSQWVPSQHAGVDLPGAEVDTAFDVQAVPYGSGKYILRWNGADGLVRAQSLAEEAGAVAYVIITHTPGFYGRGNTQYGTLLHTKGIPRRVFLDETRASALVHELGHCLFDLDDEYASASATSQSCEPYERGRFARPSVNVAYHLGALPWADMVLPTTPQPTPASVRDVVGAYEGARYCATNRWRPHRNCRMKTSTQDFCPVCRRFIDLTFSRARHLPVGRPAPVLDGIFTDIDRPNQGLQIVYSKTSRLAAAVRYFYDAQTGEPRWINGVGAFLSSRPLVYFSGDLLYYRASNWQGAGSDPEIIERGLKFTFRGPSLVGARATYNGADLGMPAAQPFLPQTRNHGNTGLWFDSSQPGTGMQVLHLPEPLTFPDGTQVNLLGTYYGYESGGPYDGEPTWVTWQGLISNGTMQTGLLRFKRKTDGTIEDTTDGNITVTINSVDSMTVTLDPGGHPLAPVSLDLERFPIGNEARMARTMFGRGLKTSTRLPGDANGNGRIDLDDLTSIAQHLKGIKAPGTPDCTRDGSVGADDVSCVFNAFLRASR